MKRSTVRSPLTWLGGLLVVYLVVPTVAFLVRLAGSHNRGFSTPGLWNALQVSVLGASIATLCITLLGVPLAYGLARSRGRLAGVVGMAVQLPLALPPLMSGILLIYLFGPYTTVGRLFHGRLTNSLAGVVLAQAFVAAPFLVVAARSAFAAVDPALDDVAATLGHRPNRRFLRVSLPVAAPGISAGMLLTWLRAFGEYGATVLLAYHPYSLPVFTDVQFSGEGLFPTQAPTALALGVAALAVVLSRLRRPVRSPGSLTLPPPREPRVTETAAVAFDLDVTVGTFRLVAAHTARSHRLAILGPSGSGKSLTLRSLAGVLGDDVGTVSYARTDVSRRPAENRGIGFVPQSFGLFPRRSVWQQVLFGAGTDPRTAAWWLHTLQLDGLEARHPGELSGGQRQRVSLAQALTRSPRVLLLDEPFSALDTPVRAELRRELRRLQRDAGLSTVLVTHDPEEAALLADEILVIAAGRILQAGTVEEVFGHPDTPQVASLLGVANLIPAVATSGGVSGGLREGTGASSPVIECAHDLAPGAEVVWAVRAERVVLDPDGAYPAEVLDVADLGAVSEVQVRLDGGAVLAVRAPGRVTTFAGARCRIDIDPASIVVWPSEPALVPAPLAVPSG